MEMKAKSWQEIGQATTAKSGKKEPAPMAVEKLAPLSSSVEVWPRAAVAGVPPAVAAALGAGEELRDVRDAISLFQ